MLHQILCYGGQTIGVVDGLVIVVAVEERHLVAAGKQRDGGLVQDNLPDDALLQSRGAALGGALRCKWALIQRHALGVELLGAALADLQQDVAHHAALQQRADAFLCAGLFGFVLDGGNQAHGGASLKV